VQFGESNVKRLEALVAEAKDTLQKAKMFADDKELQLRERENRISDVQSKLNSCSSNREYQAFVEQIAADEQANSVLSDEILEMLEKISDLQETVTSSEGDLEKGKTELQAIRRRVDDERAGLEGDVARLSNELEEAESQLPGDLKLDYQRIVKARGEDGLAPLDGESCGGCYTTITMQTFDELRLSKPVFCKSCGCLLYLPEDRDVTA